MGFLLKLENFILEFFKSRTDIYIATVTIMFLYSCHLVENGRGISGTVRRFTTTFYNTVDWENFVIK